MHTTKINKTTFIHHGDYSGDIKIISDNGQLSLPFEDLIAIVANNVRDEKIAYAENASDEQILGFDSLKYKL